MKCSAVMTQNPVCCAPTDTVAMASRLMKTSNVGPVPVVKGGGTRLLGILTDRDVVVKVVAEGRDPMSTRVEEIMTKDPVTCGPEEEVESAIESMKKRQIRRIPIVDDDNCIVGIIAQADVATHVKETMKTGELVREVSRP